MKPLLAILAAGIFLTACIPLSINHSPLVQASTLTTENSATETSSPTKTLRPTVTLTPTKVYDPITWRELNVFLAGDHTNWNAYNASKYTCVNYAMDLVANAEKQKIRSWIVSVEFDRSEIGHVFVAFPTSDMGVVWIEPQNDYAYNAVEVGKALCYVVDTAICEDFGKVTDIQQPVQCNGDTSSCWVPTN
jgi:hypothetical protein